MYVCVHVHIVQAVSATLQLFAFSSMTELKGLLLLIGRETEEKCVMTALSEMRLIRGPRS